MSESNHLAGGGGGSVGQMVNAGAATGSEFPGTLDDPSHPLQRTTWHPPDPCCGQRTRLEYGPEMKWGQYRPSIAIEWSPELFNHPPSAANPSMNYRKNGLMINQILKALCVEVDRTECSQLRN